MIVHVQTGIQAVFGQVNEDGDIVNKQPVTLDIPALKGELFAEAYEKLKKMKEDANKPAAPAPALQDK